MYLFHQEYTILLLEEPEIHLHPALIKKLLTVFEKENLDNQIFLTTHSPLFIHPNNLHRVFRVVREMDSTKVYSPRLVGRKIDYSRLTQEMNADNCEMFFADKVLLVEGPSDHILMRGLIDRFYTGAKEIKVIQVYGKSNIDVYAELLEIFNIPYEVMLDEDAIHDTGLQLIQRRIKDQFPGPTPDLFEFLKKSQIFILPNGSIEKNYPLKYQHHHKHKPLNAFHAAARITTDEYNSPLMKNIKEVIDHL
jgi:predicted ATP-dependent endonuclease of OLD family